MKKFVLTIALVAIFTLVKAQTEEGRWVVGVNSDLSFTSTSRDGQDDNINTFGLGGQVGYFVIDNLAVGGSIGLSTFSQGDFSSTSFSIGPAVRYYFNGTFFLGLILPLFDLRVDIQFG